MLAPSERRRCSRLARLTTSRNLHQDPVMPAPSKRPHRSKSSSLSRARNMCQHPRLPQTKGPQQRQLMYQHPRLAQGMGLQQRHPMLPAMELMCSAARHRPRPPAPWEIRPHLTLWASTSGCRRLRRPSVWTPPWKRRCRCVAASSPAGCAGHGLVYSHYSLGVLFCTRRISPCMSTSCCNGLYAQEWTSGTIFCGPEKSPGLLVSKGSALHCKRGVESMLWNGSGCFARTQAQTYRCFGGFESQKDMSNVLLNSMSQRLVRLS